LWKSRKSARLWYFQLHLTHCDITCKNKFYVNFFNKKKKI
jgi:hypothetical protein